MKKENSFLQKIKNFWSNLFSKTKLLPEENEKEVDTKSASQESIENAHPNIFKEAQEKRTLLELQNQFTHGKIKESDMTQEQIKALEELFDSQIKETKLTISNMKKKLFKLLVNDSETISLFKSLQSGDIKEDDLTNEQSARIGLLYDMEIEKVSNEIKELKAKIA